MDHFGYILEEADFLRLGYEPLVSPWGWRFGDYVLEQLGATFDALGSRSDVPAPPPVVTATPRAVTDSARDPLETAPATDLARLETARFEFEGGDPALGTPEVSLEVETPSGFVPVMASPTRPVVNGPDIVLRYRATPDFTTAASVTTRWHTWTAEWETLPSTPLGRYRFVARGRAQRSGEVFATITAPGESRKPVTLTWDDTARAWVAHGLGGAMGTWTLDIAPGAAHDAFGNSNAQALSLSVTR
jgi:hypothetical protein